MRAQHGAEHASSLPLRMEPPAAGHNPHRSAGHPRCPLTAQQCLPQASGRMCPKSSSISSIRCFRVSPWQRVHGCSCRASRWLPLSWLTPLRRHPCSSTCLQASSCRWASMRLPCPGQPCSSTSSTRAPPGSSGAPRRRRPSGQHGSRPTSSMLASNTSSSSSIPPTNLTTSSNSTRNCWQAMPLPLYSCRPATCILQSTAHPPLQHPPPRQQWQRLPQVVQLQPSGRDMGRRRGLALRPRQARAAPVGRPACRQHQPAICLPPSTVGSMLQAAALRQLRLSWPPARPCLQRTPQLRHPHPSRSWRLPTAGLCLAFSRCDHSAPPSRQGKQSRNQQWQQQLQQHQPHPQLRRHRPRQACQQRLRWQRLSQRPWSQRSRELLCLCPALQCPRPSPRPRHCRLHWPRPRPHPPRLRSLSRRTRRQLESRHWARQSQTCLTCLKRWSSWP